MGIIFKDVEEEKIYSAYGLTVYGKVNWYEWTIFNNQREKALTTIKINNAEGNELFSMYMGNRCILMCRIEDTLDNFLFWITKEHPDSYAIEKQVYKSLCASDSLFNHRMYLMKQKNR